MAVRFDALLRWAVGSVRKMALTVPPAASRMAMQMNKVVFQLKL
jgi:hypothetical protein